MTEYFTDMKNKQAQSMIARRYLTAYDKGTTNAAIKFKRQAIRHN
jgi:hypothetical protein